MSTETKAGPAFPMVVRYVKSSDFEIGMVAQAEKGYRLHSWNVAAETVAYSEAMADIRVSSTKSILTFHALYVPVQIAPPPVPQPGPMRVS